MLLPARDRAEPQLHPPGVARRDRAADRRRAPAGSACGTWRRPGWPCPVGSTSRASHNHFDSTSRSRSPIARSRLEIASRAPRATARTTPCAIDHDGVRDRRHAVALADVAVVGEQRHRVAALRRTARAPRAASSRLIASTATSGCARASASSRGIDARHGPHQVAQKSSDDDLAARAAERDRARRARRRARSRGSANAGAGSPVVIGRDAGRGCCAIHTTWTATPERRRPRRRPARRAAPAATARRRRRRLAPRRAPVAIASAIEHAGPAVRQRRTAASATGGGTSSSTPRATATVATSSTSTSGSTATHARSNARPSSRRAPASANSDRPRRSRGTPRSIVSAPVSTRHAARSAEPERRRATPSQTAPTRPRSWVASRTQRDQRDQIGARAAGVAAIAGERERPARAHDREPEPRDEPSAAPAAHFVVAARCRLRAASISLRACATTADGTPLRLATACCEILRRAGTAAAASTSGIGVLGFRHSETLTPYSLVQFALAGDVADYVFGQRLVTGVARGLDLGHARRLDRGHRDELDRIADQHRARSNALPSVASRIFVGHRHLVDRICFVLGRRSASSCARRPRATCSASPVVSALSSPVSASASVGEQRVGLGASVGAARLAARARSRPTPRARARARCCARRARRRDRPSTSARAGSCTSPR